MAAPNISLAQFNKIATGDYNAGLVDFKTDADGNVQNALKKVNNHVHKTDENKVVLSPERIIEVKEAFIRALRNGGVSEESINEVRAKLGIPAETKLTTNKGEMREMLAARFTPLTRQCVRVLLDSYAEGGAGMTPESRAAVSAKDAAAAKKTAAMSDSSKETRMTVNRAALALAERDGTVTRELTDALSLLSTTRTLADLQTAQHNRCTGENAVNERSMATVALQNNFASLFKVAFKMYTSNAQESETFHLFGQDAKLVRGADGKLSAILGTGELQTKVALGADAETFFSRLVGRAVADMQTLGAPTVKGLLNAAYNHDLEAGILASDRTSLTRQFACLILERKVNDAFNLCRGNYNTGILVEIAERVLTNDEEPIDTKAKLDAFHAKLVRDNAGLPDDMKAMLEQVANVPLGVPADDHSEFVVSAPIVADAHEVQQAMPPMQQGPAPEVHEDVGGMAGVKNFIADLVFSDDTMVADVVVNRPGESLRKALSTDRNLSALAEVIKNPGVIDFAVSSEIADVVKEGFAKIAALLSEAYLAQSGNETLAQALARPDGLQCFADFFRNPEKLPGEKIAQFDAIIQTMANKGCEKIQGFVNKVFKVDTANANVQGALTTDPYKDMTPEQIKAELDKKTLNEILDSASTSDAPGQVGFFRQVISTYFTQLAKADKRSCFAAAMRYAGTFEFGDKQGQDLESAKKAALNKFTGAILKGTSPLLQKMMQGLPKEVMGDFSDALADMKANLAPMPRKVVQAHLMNMIRNSNGKIKSIELMKSLGAASVGEAFLCNFKYVVREPKKEVYTDPEDGFIKLRPVLDDDGQPIIEDVEKEERLVVKIMRHDAEIRVKREAEIFTEAAKKIPGMEKTWKGQLDQYMTEFDFRTEAENVKTGVGLYDIQGGENEGLAAIAPNVTSMKLSNLVPPQKNVLVVTVATGDTVDSYFKTRIDEIRTAASSVFERDPATNRIKWEEKVVDAKTGKTKKVPVFRENIPATAIVNLQSWLGSNYKDFQRSAGYILQATKAWFHEAIFGSGTFHGDTHSGNLMMSRNEITFIDFGNLYKLESNRADGVNERHELMRVIMGAAFRDKSFVLAGFEKLLSAEGKAALAANRKKAEAILDSVLSKSKGGFSFNIVYRLKAAVSELQKLGLELPPQINCFIQSLVRLSNTVVEINTIMNQCKTMMEATRTIVRPPAPVEDIDLIGKIFNEFTSKAGQKMVPMNPRLPKGKQVPAYIMTLMSDAYGGSGSKVNEAMFKPGGEHYNKIQNAISTAADPLAKAEEIYNRLVEQADREHNLLQNAQLTNVLDPAMAQFRRDWPNARTQEAKDAVIKAFIGKLVNCEARMLHAMMLSGIETVKFVPDNPKTFASAITDILFGEFDALSEALDENEENKLKVDVYGVATGELGVGYWDATKEAKVLEAMMKDAKNMGGDKDYKVDIGV